MLFGASLTIVSGATIAPSLPGIALRFAETEGVAFCIIPTQLPFYLGELGSEAPSRVGIAIGPSSFVGIFASLSYGKLRAMFGIPGVFAVGFGFMAAGLTLIGLATSYATIVLSVPFFGLGMCIVMPNLMTGTMAVAPPRMRGRLARGLTACIFIGQFISPLVSQPLIAAFGYAAAFHGTGLLLAAVALAWALAAMRLRVARSPAG